MDLDNFVLPPQLNPEPVVESKRVPKTIPPTFTYTPEVQFYGKQYVVGEPQSTHEAAMQIAKNLCDEMTAKMLDAVQPLIGHLPQAKA